MPLTVGILTLLLLLLLSISYQDHLYPDNVETRLRSSSIKESNIEAQKEWNVKQTFENHKRSQLTQTMKWQNSVKSSAKIPDRNKYEGASEHYSSLNSLFHSKAMKWKESESKRFYALYGRDEKRTANREHLSSISEYQAILRGIGKTWKLNTPFSKADSKRQLEEKNKKIEISMSHQESQQLETYDLNVLSSQRKNFVRIKRFSSLPSSLNLPCNNIVSCAGRCSSSFQVSHNEELTCYCDIHCEYFQDCCHDFDVFCQVSNGSITKKNSTNLIQPGSSANSQPRGADFPSKNLWGWHNMTEMPKQTIGVWMISSCPQSWQKRDIYRQCKNLSISNKINLDNYQYLPVYTNNGIVYHNQFCAQCNGVSVQNLKPYQLSLDCSLTPSPHLSKADKLKFLFNYCTTISWKPKQGDPRRYRLRIVSTCSKEADLSTAAGCGNSTARLVNKNSCIYKNLKCAACHGIDTSQVVCGPYISINDKKCELDTSGAEGIPQPKSISILLDFTNPRPMTIKCQKDKIFDAHLGTCRQILSLVPKQSEVEEYRIVVWLKRIDDKPSHQVSNSQKYNNSFLIKEIFQALKVFPKQIHSTKVDKTDKLLKIGFNLKDTSSNHSDELESILNFTSPLNLTLANAIFMVVKATKRATQCVSMQLYQKHEYAPVNSSAAVYIKNTGELLRYEDYYVIENSANHSHEILVCRKIAKCSDTWVLLKENEFTVMGNRSLLLNTFKMVYGPLKQLWKNHTVYICKSYKNKLPPDEDVLFILTTICMSISIFTLVFVLITYSLFSELRTPPGINLMNLSVSILLAHLLWLAGSGRTDKIVACTAIAVLLHYFFLVSFVWTSIIAFDTWRAFQCSNAPYRMSANTKRCKRAIMTGWLSPMLYIIICVVLDTTKTVNIGYQSTYACWMSNLYYFAVPMGCILLVNIVLYSLTLKAIKVTTAQARAAVQHKNSTKLFVIYVRIASIMGFTWLSGFLIPLSSVFSYFFVILSSLQGLYIALSFGLNQRARTLYVNRFAFLTCTSSVTINSGSSGDTKQASENGDANTTETQL